METKVDRLLSDLRSLSIRFDQLERKVDEVHREAGVNNGNELFRQIDQVSNLVNDFRQRFDQINRVVQDLDSNVRTNTANLSDIKQALSLIYRNTEELKAKLLGEEDNY